jgi:hypothetical protein
MYSINSDLVMAWALLLVISGKQSYQANRDIWQNFTAFGLPYSP